MARVKQNGKWGVVDNKGGIVVPFIYDDLNLFSEGLARVKLNGKYGFIDKAGNIVVPIIYDYTGTWFSYGKVEVRRNGETYNINKQGVRIR